ncbi:hypothetical protein [Halonotius pteroides]|uniref:hypothetical protein n=1 Tax=Halonotius pteroides TaxID=268735 RepID=UPI0010586BB5|nr:hypothetical protein [Halonotius pteroides]
MGDSDEEDTEQTEEETTIQRNGEQYFFQDTAGTMGQLGEQSAPTEAKDWQEIQNELTEDEWQEKQTNDIERVRRERELARQSANNGIEQTLEEMLQRAEEIYKNQEFNLWNGEPNIENEDDEITFTRSLIKASQEAGVDTSGLADDIVSNMAEYAEQELDFVNFDNFKLSTLPSTETLRSAQSTSSHRGGPREVSSGATYKNSGFGHMPALLQYEKEGETEVKYTELTKATWPNRFWSTVRDPEDSKYRASLDQDTMKNGGFPEHFVTALDYSKARELELRNEDILGFGPNDGPADNDYESLGDEIGQFLTELVDDQYVTGYVEDGEEINQDINRQDGIQVGGTLVSDEFGESLEEYVTDPDPETREYVENIGRGIYTIRQEQGWDTDLAITGTVENPEIRGTTLERINEIRADQAYDQVRQRVAE